MWAPPQEQSVENGLFPTFRPTEVLYEFDGPRVFTLTDRFGGLNLAVWSDEDEHIERYVVAVSSASVVAALKAGRTTVREALEQPRAWICDVKPTGEVQSIWRVETGGIPADSLPKPGTMLLPELQPLLTLRAVGTSIVPGKVPGSVIRACVEGPQKALKILAEFVLGQENRLGKPSDFLRRLFDLPAQRVAFASFEISFRLPAEEANLLSGIERSPTDEVTTQVQELLTQSLTWVTSGQTETPFDDEETNQVSLRALKELTPSPGGHIDRLELSGVFAGRRRQAFVLTGQSRNRVNAALKQKHLAPTIEEFRGRVRELDKDRLSFELRDPHAEVPSLKFSFEEDTLDDVVRALSEDLVVKVIAKAYPGNRAMAEALAILEDPAGESAPTIG
jgi:hypothetical protein